MTDFQDRNNNRMCRAQRSDTSKHGGGPPEPSNGQVFSLGHGISDKEQPKLPGTSYMGSKGGPSISAIQKFNR